MMTTTGLSVLVIAEDVPATQGASANPGITPEYRAARASRETRREILATKRIRASHDKAVALGIVDANGKRLRTSLPADMQPGSDRDFGG